MKHNVLRGPLITSGLILLFLSVLIYLTSTSPDGSLWGSIGTLVVGLLKTVQLLIALSLGLLVSLAVLIGIFLGAVALVNPDTASRMFTGLTDTLSGWIAPLSEQVKSRCSRNTPSAVETVRDKVESEVRPLFSGLQRDIKELRKEIRTELARIGERLDLLEQQTAGAAQKEELASLQDRVQAIGEKSDQVAVSVDTLKQGLETIGARVDQAAEMQPVLGELTERLNRLEQESVAVQQDGRSSGASAAEAGEAEEHRIFSYLDDPADRQRLRDLVAANLKKDMTYAKFMDFLARELGGQAGEAVTSHPSLIKDYIKQCRQG